MTVDDANLNASDTTPGQGQQASQEAPAGAASGATEGASEDGITREEVETLISSVLVKANRASQSLADQVDNRVTNRLRSEFSHLDEAIQTLKGLGHDVPPELVQQAKNSALIDAFTHTEQGQAGAQEGGATGSQGLSGQGGQGGLPQGSDPAATIGLAAVAMMEAEKIWVEDNDPEVKLIDVETDSPRVFLNSINAAIEAKKLRLAGGEDDQEDESSRRKSRVPSQKQGSTPNVSSGLNAMDYFEKAYSKD